LTVPVDKVVSDALKRCFLDRTRQSQPTTSIWWISCNPVESETSSIEVACCLAQANWCCRWPQSTVGIVDVGLESPSPAIYTVADCNSTVTDQDGKEGVVVQQTNAQSANTWPAGLAPVKPRPKHSRLPRHAAWHVLSV